MNKHHLRGECGSRRVWLDGTELLPGPSQEVWNHSPDGFNWGYGGSGPAQLALAICLALTRDDQLSIGLHQGIKRKLVMHLGGDFAVTFEWDIYSGEIIRSITPAIEPNAQNPAAQPRSEQEDSTHAGI